MADGMTVTKTPREVVDAAYAALFQDNSLDGFLADFGDDAELVEVDSLPYGGVFRGRDAIKAAILNVFGYWKDLSFDVETITEGGDCVIGYGRFRAISTSTGIKVDLPLAEVWKIRNGKVLLCAPLYSDTKAVLDALG